MSRQYAQQAFDLIGRVLISPGDSVAVEEPGYPPAQMLFRSLGAQVVGVPVDDEGLDVARIPKAARLVYVTPSHQFPLGTAMSLQRRSELLGWAEQRGAVVIEDDYDSEFRFEGRPLDPLQSLDRGGRVIYVGSFSKVMLPALRVGFLIAPASLQSALRSAKQLSDWHGDLPLQAALARFIDEGLLARHIRKTAREYERRHAHVTEAIRRELHAWLQVIPSAAGLHVAAQLASGASVDLDDVVRRAEARGVVVRSLRYFSAEAPARAGLVIGYGAIPDSKIAEGPICSAARRRSSIATSAANASPNSWTVELATAGRLHVARRELPGSSGHGNVDGEGVRIPSLPSSQQAPES
jgi:GntR family transcriptional regulator/MocR family aminotransferase